MLAGKHARSALKIGRKLEQKPGTNHNRFCMVGSTDSHTSLATAQADNFFGKHSGTEPGPERPMHVVGQFGDQKIMGWELTEADIRSRTPAFAGYRKGVPMGDDLPAMPPSPAWGSTGLPYPGDLRSRWHTPDARPEIVAVDRPPRQPAIAFALSFIRSDLSRMIHGHSHRRTRCVL